MHGMKTMLETDDSRHLILLRARTHARTHAHTRARLFRVEFSNIKKTRFMKTQEEKASLTQQERPTLTSKDPTQFPTDPYQLRITF
jgi:hypothetical protein